MIFTTPRRFNVPLSQKHFLLLLGGVTLLYAFMMPDSQNLWTQYWQLLSHPTHLLHDFFLLGGTSAAFFNAATHFFLMYALLLWNNQTHLSGFQIAALGIYSGHSFIGTHLLNILPIILGVFLYAKWTNQSFKRFTTISLFATALGPFVSTFSTATYFGVWGYILGFFTGIIIGFIAPVLAEHFLKFHQGFSLYNIGFTTGMIATLTIFIFNYLGISIESRTLLSTDAHAYILGYMILLLAICFIIYLLSPQRAHQYFPKLLKSSGRLPDDFVAKYGIETVAFNVFLNGSLYLTILLVFNVTLNGAILGGWLSILGFSAFGKHLRNCVPVSLGVILAALLLKQDLTQANVILPLLLGTSLAPIAGYYGIIAGLVAGFFHFHLVGNVLFLHQGLTVYNNGFSSGFVAAFLVPIIDMLIEHKPNKL